MSEKEPKIIHVKDLIIKAENVRVESTLGRRDPLFGGKRDHHAVKEESEERSEREEKHDRKNESDDKDHRPFSWL